MPDIADGETVEMKGSASKPYQLKNTGGVYSCTCPAWRNQSTAIERRTCKHLRKYRGETAEEERIGGELPSRALKPADDLEGPPVLLAHSWDNCTDLTGWWISEKLDGVRAYWDGKKFLSRQGNEFMAPEWFVDGLPSTPLDGELWLDRKAFQKTISIVRRQDRGAQWKQIRYLVFDSPAQTAPFEERIAELKAQFENKSHAYGELLGHSRCESVDHLRSELARVESLGGEGLMLREPGSKYEIGRSSTLLKIKTFHDDEATIISHQDGKGRHKGRLGALVVKLSDGTEFSIGTGFSDKDRERPPAVGSRVTFRYQELTDGGVPRFPSFVRPVTSEVVSGAASSIIDENTRSPRGSIGRSSKTANLASSEKSAPAPSESTESNAVQNASSPRYFEFSDGKSNKFWEIAVIDCEVTVRYGRIGTDGTTNTKQFPDSATAKTHASKLISEKTTKGYVESDS